MPKLRAFLSLESTVSETIYKEVSGSSTELVQSIAKLLEQDKFQDAEQAVKEFNYKNIVEKHRQKMLDVGLMALIFGASNQSRKVKNTAFAQGEMGIPDVLENSIDQLTSIIEDGGTELISSQLMTYIDRKEAEFKASQLEKAEMRKIDTKSELAEELNRVVVGGGKSVIATAANLVTSRLVTYGFLSEAISKQITTYQVSEILDEKICPVCETMHGKTFEVSREFNKVDAALRTIDPRELKSLAPWPSQTKAGVKELRSMTPDELQQKGYGSPPYHPMCRGVLVNLGSVKQTIPVQAKTTTLLDVPVEEVIDDFGLLPSLSVFTILELQESLGTLSSSEMLLARELIGSGRSTEEVIGEIQSGRK